MKCLEQGRPSYRAGQVTSPQKLVMDYGNLREFGEDSTSKRQPCVAPGSGQAVLRTPTFCLRAKQPSLSLLQLHSAPRSPWLPTFLPYWAPLSPPSECSHILFLFAWPVPAHPLGLSLNSTSSEACPRPHRPKMVPASPESTQAALPFLSMYHTWTSVFRVHLSQWTVTPQGQEP